MEIPFDIDLKIEVQGEIIKEDAMLVYDILKVEPLSINDSLFTETYIYMYLIDI